MIAIDMAMPESCVGCRFNVSEFGYCNATPVNFCGHVNDREEDGKPEWCPLIGFDINKLKKKVENLGIPNIENIDWNDMWYWLFFSLLDDKLGDKK